MAKKKSVRQVGIGTFVATDAMKSMVNDVLDSGQITYGKYSKEFENRFAKIHSSKYGILSNSGTSSLLVALQAMKEMFSWKDGDQVAVPATTFIATANVVQQLNLVPLFIDVDPVTYNMDPIQLGNKVNHYTRAVIPVHMFGRPADMLQISGIAHSCRLAVLEDSCESMFVTSYGHPVGSIGAVGCFSLYAAHLLVSGVGGIAITSNPDIAKRMRSLVNHGMSVDQLNMDDNFSPMPAVGRRFVFDSVGHSFRITELEAAIALSQLDDRDRMIELRTRNASYLTAALDRLWALQLPTNSSFNKSAFMMYPIVISSKCSITKAEAMAYLNERGIQTRDMPSLLYQPVYKDIRPEDYPVSMHLANNGFYVGCHQNLTIEDMTYVADNIISLFKNAKKVKGA